MSEQPINRINYGLVKIITEQLDLSPELVDENKPVKINAGLNFGIDPKQRLLKVLFKNVFLQEDEPFITIETGCIFVINPEAWEMLSDLENNRFMIPRHFAGHLAVLTASTARGILHNETEHTPLNRYFIPANNVEEMIKEDVLLPL
jgi:hypothetical protein